jgi:hypothetical protein
VGGCIELTDTDATCAARELAYELSTSTVEVIHRADNADPLLGNSLVDNRRRVFQLFNIDDDILFDRVIERIAGLIEHRLDRGSEGGHERSSHFVSKAQAIRNFVARGWLDG